MLCREDIAAVLSELAWLQVEADLAKLLAESSESADVTATFRASPLDAVSH